MKLSILSLTFPPSNGHPQQNIRTAFFLFEAEGAVLKSESTVCMSRNKPGECNFALGAVHEHAPHSPVFANEEDFAAYVERITNDIRQVIKENGYEPEKDLKLVVDEKVVMPPTMLSMN